jgi:hypothetical protein
VRSGGHGQGGAAAGGSGGVRAERTDLQGSPAWLVVAARGVWLRACDSDGGGRQRSTRTDRSRPGTRMVWWRCGRPWGSIAGIKFRGGWGGFGLGPQGGEGAGGGHVDGEGGAGPAGVLRSDVALLRILGKRRGIVFRVPRIFPPLTRDCLWRRSQSEALFHSFPKLGWRCYF